MRSPKRGRKTDAPAAAAASTDHVGDNGAGAVRGIAASRRALLAALALVFVAYAFGAYRIARTDSIWSPDCGARFIQVQSVLEHWPQWHVSYPAADLDPRHENSPLYFFEFNHAGRTYVFYSFLWALLSACLFRLFGFFGLVILPLLGGLGAALAVYGTARLLRLRHPVLPLLLVALATPLAVYSVVFWDHSVITGIAAAALYLGLRAVVTGRTQLWFGAGAVIGAGLWFHEILLPCIPALIVVAWWTRRKTPWLRAAAWLLLGTALLAVPLALVNQAVYGTPAGPHLSNNRMGSASSIAEFVLSPREWGPGAIYTLFFWGDTSPAFPWQLNDWLARPWPKFKQEMEASARMAIPVLLWIPLALSGGWRRRWIWPLSLLLFAGMIAGGVWVARHLEWAHSLFLASPLLVLAFAAGRGEPDGSETRLLRQGIAVFAVVYLCLTLPKPTLGGTEWGARHLLVLVPALTLLASAAIENLLPKGRNWQPGARPLLGGIGLLIALSFWLQIHGFRIVERMHERNREIARAIADTPDQVIVGAEWWPALNGAPSYLGKKMLFAGDTEHPALPLLERMRGASVRSFTLISYAPQIPIWTDALRYLGYVPVANATRSVGWGLTMSRYLLLDLPAPRAP